MTEDRAWPSSASATSACRWRSRSSRPASRSRASTPRPGASRSSAPDDRPIDDVSDERLGDGARCAACGSCSPDDVGDVRGGRDLRLRPDADHRDQGPGPRPGPARRRDDPRTRPHGPADRPPVDDVPGHDDRPVPRGPRAERPARPATTSTSPSRPSGSTRAIRRARRRASRGSSARRRRQATTRAAALLRNINDQVVELSSPDAAELAKLLENVFRNINIAFVNQLALLCERMGLDVWEVIDAAATKPFGFMKFTPGPGVGGHCIPVDPVLPVVARPRVRLHRPLHRARRRHQLRDAAPRRRPRRRGAQRPRAALKGAKVGVLGVAFKPNVQDARNSPAAEVLAGHRRARRRGALPRPARRRRSATPPASCARTRRSTSCSTGPT